MPKKRKVAARRASAPAVTASIATAPAAPDVVRIPQSTAHSFRREMQMPPESLVKMKEVLAQGLPMKISLDVTSKVYAPTVAGGEFVIGTDIVTDGEIVIDQAPATPPDGGGDIPEEAQVQTQAPTSLAAAKSPPEVTGVTIEIYAVAVFRPQYAPVS